MILHELCPRPAASRLMLLRCKRPWIWMDGWVDRPTGNECDSRAGMRSSGAANPPPERPPREHGANVSYEEGSGVGWRGVGWRGGEGLVSCLDTWLLARPRTHSTAARNGQQGRSPSRTDRRGVVWVGVVWICSRHPARGPRPMLTAPLCYPPRGAAGPAIKQGHTGQAIFQKANRRPIR